MPYKTFRLNKDVDFVDIHTMSSMKIDEYEQYIREGLLSVDHHDVLRSEPAGYPLAVTKEQFKALLAYLKELEPRIGA